MKNKKGKELELVSNPADLTLDNNEAAGEIESKEVQVKFCFCISWKTALWMLVAFETA